MHDNLHVVTVQLTSREKRQLAQFVTLDKAEQHTLIRIAELDPQTSGPLLYAYKVVNTLLA